MEEGRKNRGKGREKDEEEGEEIINILGYSLGSRLGPVHYILFILQNGLVGSPCSPRDSQESSPTPQFKSTSSSVLSLLHSPTLTSIHDHRKNHSLDWTDLCWQSNVSAPSSRAESLLFLHGLESNPGSSLQTEEEAGLP